MDDQQIEIDDLELAVGSSSNPPSLPEESECTTSSDVIEEQQPRSTYRRKKILAAVVSIVVVAAIAIGVAVSTKSSKQSTSPPDEKTGVMQNNSNQDVFIVIDNERGDDEPPSSVYESSGDEPPSNETPAVVDDESQDIILDVGSDAEHPDDLIYSEGYEQREEPAWVDPETEVGVHETTEEKVAFIDDVSEEEEEEEEDLAIATIATTTKPLNGNLEGPIADLAELSRITVTTSSSCPTGETPVRLDLFTDRYPWEQSYKLTNPQGKVIASGPPTGRNFARSTKYVGILCMKPGQYTLAVEDKNGDGFCCTYGNGKMSVIVNGKSVAETSDEKFSQLVKKFSVTAPQSNNKPPTKKPTLRPTPPPTPPLGNAEECSNYKVEITVVTDRFGGETGYKFRSVSSNSILSQKSKGSLQPLKTYTDTICVDKGKYRLTMEDSFRGLQENGSYSVKVNDEEVMWGSIFKEPSITHNIRVGYEPPMTANNRLWLNAHNRRRKKFHEDNNVPYRELQWSTELAAAASNWADVILNNNCKISREPGLVAGENISARAASGTRNEGAEAILKRWVDAKVNLGYPQNQSMTQVHWRGTRAVGCSEKSAEIGGGTCYVSICRYARAGNCAMGRYNGWLEATLADRTTCGPICSGPDCY
ncbi:hypothetical protein ACHAXR_008687 [Thalassiosira sp. AJA248-18]